VLGGVVVEPLDDRHLRDVSGMLMTSIAFEVIVPELGLAGLVDLAAAGRKRR
jgi:hypothetical protein